MTVAWCSKWEKSRVNLPPAEKLFNSSWSMTSLYTINRNRVMWSIFETRHLVSHVVQHLSSGMVEPRGSWNLKIISTEKQTFRQVHLSSSPLLFLLMITGKTPYESHHELSGKCKNEVKKLRRRQASVGPFHFLIRTLIKDSRTDSRSKRLPSPRH